MQPFHLAFPVTDLTEARAFYGDLLGCPEGRSSSEWVDFNFYGHQIVAHLSRAMNTEMASSEVDGHGVPVRHFGLVMNLPEWEKLAAKLKAIRTKFIIEPATMFFLDPFGNAIEFKALKSMDSLFAT
jgi:uncharacterized protein